MTISGVHIDPKFPPGAVMVWRCEMQDVLYQYDDEPFDKWHCWQDLVFQAEWETKTVPRQNLAIVVRRGQVFVTQAELARRWRRDRGTVKKFLDLLVTLGKIKFVTSRDSKTGYTLITILDYDRYQGVRPATAPKEDAAGARIVEWPLARIVDGDDSLAPSAPSEMNPLGGSPSKTIEEPASRPHPARTPSNYGSEIRKVQEEVNTQDVVDDGEVSTEWEPSRKAGRATRRVVDVYAVIYEQTRGRRPEITDADVAVVEGLLRGNPVEEVTQVVRAMFNDSAPEEIRRNGYRLTAVPRYYGDLQELVLFGAF